MRILLLTHSFNSLTQRVYCELAELGHELSVEFDIGDAVSAEAVALFAPDLIVAPFLKRAIPESIWAKHVCLVVHPGIVGDRGPSALDWTIQHELREWGVTVLQADAVMDGGPVWAAAGFPLRAGKKSSIYRNEVAEAAVLALRVAVDRVQAGNFAPQRVPGQAHPPMKQPDRAIEWTRHTTAAILARVHAADGHQAARPSRIGHRRGAEGGDGRVGCKRPAVRTQDGAGPAVGVPYHRAAFRRGGRPEIQ